MRQQTWPREPAKWKFIPSNQSINPWIDKSINQPINRAIKQSNNQSSNRTINQSINQSTEQSIIKQWAERNTFSSINTREIPSKNISYELHFQNWWLERTHRLLMLQWLTGTLPFLKSLMVLSRSNWSMPPCSAMTMYEAFIKSFKSWSAFSCLSTKTRVLPCGEYRPKSSNSLKNFSSSFSTMTCCSTSFATTLRPPT